MNLEEKTIAKETVYNGRLLRLDRDTVILADGKERTREVIVHPGAACVACLNADNEVAVVRQYRYAAGRVLLELPAGKLNEGESPREAAERELYEETGLKPVDLLSLGSILPTPGYSTEVIYLFAARAAVKNEARPDEGEIIENNVMPLDTLVQMVYDGDITDSKTAVLVLKAKKAVEEGKI